MSKKLNKNYTKSKNQNVFDLINQRLKELRERQGEIEKQLDEIKSKVKK